MRDQCREITLGRSIQRDHARAVNPERSLWGDQSREITLGRPILRQCGRLYSLEHLGVEIKYTYYCSIINVSMTCHQSVEHKNLFCITQGGSTNAGLKWVYLRVVLFCTSKKAWHATVTSRQQFERVTKCDCNGNSRLSQNDVRLVWSPSISFLWNIYAMTISYRFLRHICYDRKKSN